jgi:hypothetical protein
MRVLAGIVFLIAFIAVMGGCKRSDSPDTGYAIAGPLPIGVTAGWPIDPRDPEDTTCGIGIHYEDTFALTDAQLATARKYVAQTCWGASDYWPTDTEHTYYYHRQGTL